MVPVIATAVFLLVTVGVFLLLHRSLLRVALGLACLSHAVHLVVLSAGRWGTKPALVRNAVVSSEVTDPVVQAFVLTAIVISLSFALYLLAGMAAVARRGGEPEVAAAPEDDRGRDTDSVLAELEGRKP